MTRRFDARRVLSWIARAALLLVGLWALEKAALDAFGGKERLEMFVNNDANRFTSRAMLSGSLTLRNTVFLLWHDEQIYNGADYTNWGFGVPLLEMPFHWLAGKRGTTPQGFFPDRKIFFVYLAITIPILWAAFDRLLVLVGYSEERWARRHFFSWAATLMTCACAVFQLIAARFLQYEEAIAYFAVVELLALAAYIFTLESERLEAVVALGALASLGLLVRPTGAFYLAGWGALVLLERGTRKAAVAFAAGAAPLVVFWLYSNHVRTGSFLAVGSINSIPFFDYHMPAQRFGGVCVDSVKHAGEIAWRLFDSFFFTTGSEAPDWLKTCHFDVETRPHNGSVPATTEPLFGVAVLVLFVWMLLHLLRLRERRLSPYVPFGIILVLFALFVVRGNGFAWRYIGDFWPAIILACVEYARAIPQVARKVLGVRVGLAFVACAWSLDVNDIEPVHGTIETLSADRTAALPKTYAANRAHTDPVYSPHLTCENHATEPFHNGQGWKRDCSVDPLTNLYLGVPPREGDHYELRFATEGASAAVLRVYLNGRIYEAHREGTMGYRADVTIPFAKLGTPLVITTIEWTRSFDAPPGVKLLSIDLS